MILYLDTSTNLFVTGIVENGKLITSINETLGNLMSEVAMDKLTGMFENKNILPSDIKKIIVVNGPGSFTGIRVGITIAKTYAWALKIPIIEISGLEAMMTSTECDDGDLPIVPVIDARRDYVYAAIYTPDKRELLSPRHIAIKKLKEHYFDQVQLTIVTNDDINIAEKKRNYVPNILKIVESFEDREASDPHMVNPNYLKLTEAEESRQ